MKKRTIGRAAAAAAAAAGVFGAGSAALASFAVHGARYSGEETIKNDLQDYPSLREYAPLAGNLQGTARYIVPGADGTPLHVQYYAGPAQSRRFVILVHGYTMNRFSMLKYMPIYMDMGYHCVIYDHRGHGDNDRREVCTFGGREAKDLIKIIEDTYARWGKDIFLGLHGESLGTATLVTALRYKPDIRFAVCDCGFADVINVMKVGMKGMHLPQALVYPASAASRVIYGEGFTNKRPIDSLSENQVPLCFIHGAKDDFIKPSNSERMWRATQGYAELHLFPGAAHARSLFSDPVRYRRVVTDFVRRAQEMAEQKDGK